MSQPDGSVVLDADAAIRCPVKVQNYYDQTIQVPAGADTYATRGSSDLQQELFGAARAFTAEVLDLLAARPDTADLRPLAEEDWTVAQDATRDAVLAGVPLIVGPKLPVDHKGHRRGSPALLVRGADRSQRRPGYLPVHVRARRMLERHSRPGLLACSLLTTPHPEQALDLVNARLRTGREDDQLLMAHFWRLLEACDWQAAGEATAGVIGNDALVPAEHTAEAIAGLPGLALANGRGSADSLAVAWLPLTRKQIRTFSRTAPDGWKERSALERYDHEHGFRVKVAQVAKRRTGSASDPRQMVAPIYIRECSSCQWWSVCAPRLGDGDLSRTIDKSPLDVREISVLRGLGVRSVHDLGDADLEALLPRYLPEVRHRPGAEERLRLAARRARMIASGTEIERITTGPIPLPEADLEIDWDIETAANDRVYLWGFWVRRPGDPTDTGRYEYFVDFEDLDQASELTLARSAMRWLTDLLRANPNATVQHYSDYEMVHLAKLADQSGADDLREACELLRQHHFDLFTLVKKHFFGAHGLGLKVIATAAAGFRWRDDTPGGLNSQSWFNEAVHSSDPQTRADAGRRILEYNEDDVRATAALRAWLRTL